MDGQYSETNLIDCGDSAIGGSAESYTISTEDLLTSQQGPEWEVTELPYVNSDASSPRKALYNNGKSGFFYSSPLKVEPGQSIKLDMDMALWFRVGSETAQFYSKPSLVEFEFERLSSCGSNASVENTENILSYKADAMATSGQRLLVFSNDFADVMKQTAILQCKCEE
ncbi:hypothetical protein [Pseudobacteriovorax antillogorgiicola]|uniref:hypothetical protein n=1 Tax=Pseudobacteriovorax antillogorgiicola TaxID=1513793 RepID=UPI001A9EF972|nr:hypothetical protein [Pseudobacteriovorax antillogorgiicola]